MSRRAEHESQCSVSSAAKDSRDEQKILTATKEDLKLNTVDIPVVIPRQMLGIQEAPRTADVPLLQYSDTTVDVPVAKDAEKAPQRQYEDCMTKCNEIQKDKKLQSAYLRTENKKQKVFDSESRSDSSFTVQKDTEVIHREVRGGTETNCYLKENQSKVSATRRLKDSGEETRCTMGNHVMRCATLTTPAKTVVRRRSSRQIESTNRSSMCVCHCRFWKRDRRKR